MADPADAREVLDLDVVPPLRELWRKTDPSGVATLEIASVVLESDPPDMSEFVRTATGVPSERIDKAVESQSLSLVEYFENGTRVHRRQR
jgi:hypothetical protein